MSKEVVGITRNKNLSDIVHEGKKTIEGASLKILRRGTLVAGISVRLLLCPGDDIALASSTTLHAVDSDHAQAILPSKDSFSPREIVWEEAKKV